MSRDLEAAPRYPYAPFKDSLALKPHGNPADFRFSTLDSDKRAWTAKANGLQPGFTISAAPRDTRTAPRAEGADRMFEFDSGPKAGLAAAVKASGFSRMNTTFSGSNRWAGRTRPATAEVGPGSYFADPRSTASPIRSRAMTAALLNAKGDTRAKTPGMTTYGGLAIRPPAAMANDAVTKEELQAAIMHYSHRKKHLMHRRAHKKPSADVPDAVVSPSAKALRQWTHRLAAVEGMSIGAKGTQFPKDSRFKRPQHSHPTPGPGAYTAHAGFVKPTPWKASAEDAFPTTRSVARHHRRR